MAPDHDDLRSELEREAQRLEQRFAQNPQGRVFAPLADKYRQLGRLEEAEAVVLEGLKRHPDYLSAYLVLGRIYTDWGRPEDAAVQFTRVLELDPQNLVALRALGDVAAAGGDWVEARRWYQRILEIDPYNEEVEAALAGLGTKAAEGVGGPPQAEAVEEGPVAGYSRYGEEFVEEGPAQPAVPEAAVPEEPAVVKPMAPPSAEPTFEEAPEAAAPPAAESELATEPPVSAAAEPVFREETAEEPAIVRPFVEETRRVEAPTPVEPDARLITETMADLYADQGLYDDAIDVYRDLLEQRPEDPAIQRRIAELEKLAEQRMAGAAPAPMGPEELLPREQPEPVREPSEVTGAAPVSAEPMPLAVPAGEAETVTAPAGEGIIAVPPIEEAPAAIAEEAPLPDWLLGLPAAAGPQEPSAAVGLPDTMRAAEDLALSDVFAAAFEEAAAAEKEPAFALQAEPPAGPEVWEARPVEVSPTAPPVSVTIGEYLRALLASPTSVSSPAVTIGPSPERPSEARAPAAGPEPTAPPSAAEAAPETGVGGAGGAGGAGAGQEDDLAQFQAWLRSLKR
ncbi:MAG: tetratricopeptide repeat protein [Gemmatimonadetes bacterium]|nr:tetratricopeptide repeat protein [Gemmatimonadota bacterium]